MYFVQIFLSIFCMIIILSGCGGPKPFATKQDNFFNMTEPSKNEDRSVDLRSYSRKGFLFSPNEYQGEFEAKGLIFFKIRPSLSCKGCDEISFCTRETNSYCINNQSVVKKIVCEEKDSFSFKEVIKRAYLDAVKLDADAIINVVLNRRKVNLVSDNRRYTYYEVSFSGYAIKRK